MSMLRLIAAVLLLLAPVPGLAQAPQLPAGQVLGNDTASTRTARGASLSAMFDRGLSSTRGAILERGAAGWVAITPGTAGLPFVSAGAGADPLYQVLGLSGGGTNNGSIVASNGGIVYSDATKLNILAATATARQMLQSGASGAPAWSTTTWPATTTVNRILYSSSASVIGEIATANSGILVTDGSGVPSISTTLPSGLTGAALTKVDDTNVTVTLGGSASTALVNAASITLGWNGQLALTRGGSNASLTASNGGIVYSGASALAILSGTATANQVLLSGSSAAPAWSTATYPATTTVNQLLYSSSANVIAGLTTANGGVLNTSGAGVPSITPTPTIGVNGGTGGQITFNGSTSGSVALRVAAAAGTGTIFQLPADNGSNTYVLQTNGSGVTSWVAAAGGGTVTSITCAASLTCTAANPIVATGTIAINLGNSNAWTAAQTIQSTSATAFAVGANGATNPVLLINANTASQATGISITGAAAAGGVAVAAISSGTNENLTINAKGSGTITLGNSSTGGITLTRAVTLGVAGSVVGSVIFNNATSGTITLQPTTGALSTRTITMPAITGTMTVTVASGAKALATSAISSGACSSAQTDTATGALTTDAIDATFSADPTSTTGYSASTSGMLTIIAYPTADTVNFKVCNNTGSSITPGAVTINWRVRR